MGSTAHHCLVTSPPPPLLSSRVSVYTCASKCGPSISLCIQKRDFGIASRPVHLVTRFPPPHWRGKKENGRSHLCPPNSSACPRDTPRTPGSSFLLLLRGRGRYFRGNARDNSNISCRLRWNQERTRRFLDLNFNDFFFNRFEVNDLREKGTTKKRTSKMLMFPKVYYFWRIYSSDWQRVNPRLRSSVWKKKGFPASRK